MPCRQAATDSSAISPIRVNAEASGSAPTAEWLLPFAMAAEGSVAAHDPTPRYESPDDRRQRCADDSTDEDGADQRAELRVGRRPTEVLIDDAERHARRHRRRSVAVEPLLQYQRTDDPRHPEDREDPRVHRGIRGDPEIGIERRVAFHHPEPSVGRNDDHMPLRGMLDLDDGRPATAEPLMGEAVLETSLDRECAAAIWRDLQTIVAEAVSLAGLRGEA